MEEFIRFCEEVSLGLLATAQNVIEYVTTPVMTHLENSIVPDWFFELLPTSVETYFTENSIIEIMFGAGLTAFISVVMAKFVIDLIRGD